ncbi:hypothetical protein V1477_007705 [Vespula maculifrons]|uniref:Uncharacterized protein n=1 Tax=Vespula maculifrons TaxID=7453 RepID=A0ABD2CFH9_VESMC
MKKINCPRVTCTLSTQGPVQWWHYNGPNRCSKKVKTLNHILYSNIENLISEVSTFLNEAKSLYNPIANSKLSPINFRKPTHALRTDQPI